VYGFCSFVPALLAEMILMDEPARCFSRVPLEGEFVHAVEQYNILLKYSRNVSIQLLKVREIGDKTLV
jgi:hypothetical protein